MVPPDWKQYSPDPTPDAESPATAARRPRRRRRPGTASRVLMALAAGVVAIVAFYVVRAVTEPDDPQTVDGFAELLSDLADETGGTEVFEAVVYPDFAVVDVPVAPGDERELSLHWDGGLTESSKGTSTHPVFDLASIDPAHFGDMCRAVAERVEDPDDCYLIVRAPDDTVAARADGWISAHVSNEFSQGAWIVFDRDGREVDRSD